MEHPEELGRVIAADLFHSGRKVWMIIIDYYSWWLEAKRISRETTAESIIRLFKEKLAIFGIPNSIHTDNGPPFSYYAFAAFLGAYGISHTISSLY